MFCPKCGGEANENQRYCKSCGTHLQMIYDALGGSEHKGIYGIDIEALSRNARKFADSWKAGQLGAELRKARWRGAEAWKAGWGRPTAEQMPVQPTSPPLPPSPPLPKPREWLRYSRQHNLREGLGGLFGGAGLGIALYYFGQSGVIQEILRSIEPLSRTGANIDAIARLLSLLWLFAAIPVLKGLGHILYAAFFGESMAKLTDRFIPKPVQVVTAPQPAMLVQEEERVPTFTEASEPVSSVTEHTTQIIDGPSPVARIKTNE